MNSASTQWFDVRGTKYYDAKALVHEGRLRAGTPLLLKHQPDNPHDGNAVQVIEAETGRMLGHLPREHAMLVGNRLRRGQITHVRVSSVERMTLYPKIRICITYSISESESLVPDQPMSDHARYNADIRTGSVRATGSDRASSMLALMVIVALAITYCRG